MNFAEGNNWYLFFVSTSSIPLLPGTAIFPDLEAQWFCFHDKVFYTRFRRSVAFEPGVSTVLGFTVEMHFRTAGIYHPTYKLLQSSSAQKHSNNVQRICVFCYYVKWLKLTEDKQKHNTFER